MNFLKFKRDLKGHLLNPKIKLQNLYKKSQYQISNPNVHDAVMSQKTKNNHLRTKI